MPHPRNAYNFPLTTLGCYLGFGPKDLRQEDGAELDLSKLSPYIQEYPELLPALISKLQKDCNKKAIKLGNYDSNTFAALNEASNFKGWIKSIHLVNMTCFEATSFLTTLYKPNNRALNKLTIELNEPIDEACLEQIIRILSKTVNFLAELNITTPEISADKIERLNQAKPKRIVGSLDTFQLHLQNPSTNSLPHRGSKPYFLFLESDTSQSEADCDLSDSASLSMASL